MRLADCYVALGGYRSLSPEVAYGSAKEALRKALELDSGLASSRHDAGHAELVARLGLGGS